MIFAPFSRSTHSSKEKKQQAAAGNRFSFSKETRTTSPLGEKRKNQEKPLFDSKAAMHKLEDNTINLLYGPLTVSLLILHEENWSVKAKQIHFPMVRPSRVDRDKIEEGVG